MAGHTIFHELKAPARVTCHEINQLRVAILIPDPYEASPMVL